MKFFPGLLAAGLVLTATAASAQMGSTRVSDFSGPYVEGPYRGPQYAPPPVEVAPPPPRYGYAPGYGYGPGYGYAPTALVPPHEVYNIIREAGFSPLGVPRQRGFIYTIAVIDRGGEDGRVVIDARSGRILRFVPAWQHGAPYEGAWNSSYGPPGPLPPAPGLRSGVNPPAAPQVVSRSVPVPKPSPISAKPQVEAAKPAEPAAAKPAIAKPAFEAAVKPAVEAAKPAATEAAKPVSPPSSQQAAATPPKPADTAPATTATIGQTQAKPAPSIQPTQEMPRAQGLE